ncbi:DUF4097 family beta strand repeat-containing protein [Parapedobacter koreensis]|uniref:Uncharacterized protein n=1 Tax=Parapedobacter koreensis TaxID=332977 RepID=A0A1H7QMC8_9SPHI|nr:DUF4097 family beta strand repeat-containing protein [Parapedobacter koreensis]SEL49281.1 hypothetical protein SAMN05421740_10615 [Parapedobacter koreensis]
MKKQTIILAIFLSLCYSARAQQEYKITHNAGRLIVNDLLSVTIEGYDGSDIIFTSRRAPEEEDPRAKGLQALNSSGLKDNTGLGISVVKNDQEVQVTPVSSNGDRNEMLRIRVPQQVAVVFIGKTTSADTIAVKNMKGEIELSSTYHRIALENNSGPMNIKSIHGDIDASFGTDVKGPISIISAYGHVDVALPTVTKANLSMGSSYGKLYASDEFNIVVTPQSNDNEDQLSEIATSLSGTSSVSVASSRSATRTTSRTSLPAMVYEAGAVNIFAFRERESIKGTLNGGGIDLILRSTHQNVYLRTK